MSDGVMDLVELGVITGVAKQLTGGFGTLDELYESLTLIQTGKIRQFPVVLFDSDYWGEMIDWISVELLADGMISPDDIELLHVTDDPDEAVRLVLECYERAARRGRAPRRTRSSRPRSQHARPSRAGRCTGRAASCPGRRPSSGCPGCSASGTCRCAGACRPRRRPCGRP